MRFVHFMKKIKKLDRKRINKIILIILGSGQCMVSLLFTIFAYCNYYKSISILSYVKGLLSKCFYFRLLTVVQLSYRNCLIPT